MELKTLTESEITMIYNTHMQTDFPATELKPLSTLLREQKLGHYFGCGLFEADTLKAYAMFAVSPCGKYLILDYYAVVKAFRGQKIGSRVLQTMQAELLKTYQNILGEVEDPDYSLDDADRSIRTRRIGFYERNGAIMSDVKAKVDTDRYLILYFGEKMETKEIKEQLWQFYKLLYGDAFDKMDIQITA